MPMKVVVLMGGPSEECEVSKATGAAVSAACRSLGYDVLKLSFQDNYEALLPKLKNADIVFNALHGGMGENGEIQAWMEGNLIVYTGSGPEASELCMDKSRSKAVARNLGVKTADWELLHHVYETYSIGLPFVVKPNTQGSTVGLTVVHNKNEIKPAIKDAFVHGKSVMIEKYINGRELTVTVLGSKAYPIVEIQPSHDLYDYECKYTPGMSKYICPADLSPKLTNKIKRDTENIFKGLGCEVYGRADYLLADDGQYFFLEMNTLPGMTDTSLVPKAVAAEGLSFEKLVKKIIELSQ